MHYWLTLVLGTLVYILLKSYRESCNWSSGWLQSIIVQYNLAFAECFVLIDFMFLLLMCKALNGLSPSYISEILHLYLTPRSPRSFERDLLPVPWSRLKLVGDQVFEVAAPIMEQPPTLLISTPITNTFKNDLTFLFLPLAFEST